jgi:hypothetical protein
MLKADPFLQSIPAYRYSSFRNILQWRSAACGSPCPGVRHNVDHPAAIQTYPAPPKFWRASAEPPRRPALISSPLSSAWRPPTPLIDYTHTICIRTTVSGALSGPHLEEIDAVSTPMSLKKVALWAEAGRRQWCFNTIEQPLIAVEGFSSKSRRPAANALFDQLLQFGNDRVRLAASQNFRVGMSPRAIAYPTKLNLGD